MKVNKYDRQIRLWGQNGQRKLGQARVALLGASGAGIQALKNLVLPGVGNIEIWAQGKIELQDLATSFFYAPEDVGKAKAEVLLANLLQMNPEDVKGQAFIANPLDILKDRQGLKRYNLLICGDLRENANRQISAACYQLNIPVVFITVVGFYIYVRNQQRLHFVESENTTSKKFFMRLQDPFPALKQYSNQWNIEQLIHSLSLAQKQQEKTPILNQLRFIPYPIILLQIYEQIPTQLKSQQHKFTIQQQIKQLLLQRIKDYSLVLGEDHRDNFTQASNRTLDLFQTVDNFLPDIAILDNLYVESANARSPHVFQFLKACKHFYSKFHSLPQPTKLPDMHTSTKVYLEFKQIYRQQHQLDIAKLKEILIELLGASHLSNDQVSNLIDNIEALKIIQFGSYEKELTKVQNPNLPWQAPQWRNIVLALRAYKLFEQNQQRSPLPSDFEVVWDIANSLRKQYGFDENIDDRYVRQVCRVQGKSTISINSIGGAVAGQQAIKLITNCFTPVKSGYVYSGVHSIGYSISI